MKNIVVIAFIVIGVFTYSCGRPLFVTHWTGKGKALMKKRGWGYPNHGLLAGVVCMNKLCLNKRERINKMRSKRFKGYKNNSPVPSNDKGKDTLKSPSLMQNSDLEKSTSDTVRIFTFDSLIIKTNH